MYIVWIKAYTLSVMLTGMEWTKNLTHTPRPQLKTSPHPPTAINLTHTPLPQLKTSIPDTSPLQGPGADMLPLLDT